MPNASLLPLILSTLNFTSWFMQEHTSPFIAPSHKTSLLTNDSSSSPKCGSPRAPRPRTSPRYTIAC
jgi:hypothetical protein